MKITVCAGHDPKKPGAFHHGVKEHELMLQLRDIVAAKLTAKGHEVRTDGGRGINLPLLTAMGLVRGSDIAIELHTNAHDDPRAGGVESISLPAQKPWAEAISNGIADVLQIKLRGTNGWIDQSKSARGRLGFVNSGGIIVETFFLSNKLELERYQARYWLVADAIARAIGGD